MTSGQKLLAASPLAIAFAALAVYAATQHHGWMFAVGLLVALAGAMTGVLLGFLFGLPHYNPAPPPPPDPSGNSDATTVAAMTRERTVAAQYVPSTNLEQISDWLTKLLLGAGLVQLGPIAREIGRFVDAIAGGFAPTDPGTPAAIARVVAGSVVAFFFSYGFVGGYVGTTLWYAHRLDRTIEKAKAAKAVAEAASH